ncbi:Cullin-1 [Rhizoctonia solani]|uniref:Cullin-1 n=1 Tax=Rhizoctonia solani TaxID=456999 RepID=A0A0K6FXW5_9AGAM|nr:Cullin-1 [Rhizoctonia solani]
MADASTAAIPPPSAGLTTIWPIIEEWIEHVMNGKQIQDSYPKYIRLHTIVYNYLTSSRLEGPFQNILDNKSATLTGLALYDILRQYFATYVKGIKQRADLVIDEGLLDFYANEWDCFATGAGYVNHTLSYFNRHWVRREQQEGRKVFQVYYLVLAQWRDHLLYPIQTKDRKLIVLLLSMIEKERDSETIDTSLVKKAIDSLVALGLDDNNQNTADLQVYLRDFQKPFLEATEKYYARESATFFQTHTSSIPNYLKKTEECLCEEEARAVRCLHSSTLTPLIKICKNALIQEHLARLQEDAQTLLYSGQDEDLQRMSQLLCRIPEGLDPLKERWGEDIQKAGLEAAVDLSRVAASSPDGIIEPKIVINTLFAVYCENRDFVNRSFHGKALAAFTAISDWAFSNYADALLRKNKLCEEEILEDQLNKVITLFKYIEDKDVFQAIYRVKLSRRLIYSLSDSSKNEAYMILKLKETCGFEYTDKLQRMFIDTQLSKDLTTQFNERMAITHDSTDLKVAFKAMILGANFWPLGAPLHSLVIPGDILPIYKRFQLFYGNKHSGRKLTWLWSYSENELGTNYLNRKYILLTSSYQMAVLTQYNTSNTLHLDELVTATGIPKDSLTQVLMILTKAKILMNKETNQYDLNTDFKSKKIRLKLNQPIKTEIKRESIDSLKSVNEDRKYVIQAAIVRIMKTCQMMSNQALVQEVTSQISSCFAPKSADIKKAIDKLLEKEYIEQVGGDMDFFKYIA